MRSLAGLGLLVPLTLAAQTYPTKPIRTLLSAGGSLEVQGRLLGQKLSESLGQPVITELQTAAAGTIAAGTVARAQPDGYTLLYTTISTHVWLPTLAKARPYDPVKDFTPIAKTGESFLAYVANNSFEPGTMKELVEQARRNPGKVTYATTGIGTVHHLSGEMLQRAANISLLHVTYKSSPQIITDLLAGRIDTAFSALGTFQPLIEAKKIKVLGINNSIRSPGMPDVPTIAEQVPGYSIPNTWLAYFGPAGMQPTVVRRLHDELAKILAQPDVIAKSEQVGFAVVVSTPEQLAAQLRQDLEAGGKLVKAAGIEPE
jgi:tripartite-type tricarboxylate transporter receptor subunit TctC